MAPMKDITGKRFGRLTAIKHDGWYTNEKSKKRHSRWLCSCECGNEKNIDLSHLLRGSTQSCGCLSKEHAIKLNKIHGKINGQLKKKDGSALRSRFNHYKQNAKSRNIEFDIDFELFSNLVTQNCIHCNEEPKMNLQYYNAKKAYAQKNGSEFQEEYFRSQIPSMNGLDRIDPTKGYIVNNLQTMCSTCNIGKMAHEGVRDHNRHNSNEAFITHCFKIVEHYKMKQLKDFEQKSTCSAGACEIS